MANRRPVVLVSGRPQEMPAGDLVPIAALASGTPDGTKFIRDDGTLVAPTATVADGSITNAKLANMVQATIKGRASGAGTGVPVDLTAAQTIAILLAADGSGSGLDADLLDGFNADQNPTGSTIPVRSSSGYLFATYYNQSSGNNENPTISQIYVDNGADGYHRKASLAHVKSSLGVPTTLRNLTRWESSGHTITATSLLTQAHGLGVIPILTQVILQCQTAELGFTTGMEVNYTSAVNAGNVSANPVSADATNIYVETMNAIFIVRKDTHVLAAITLANWRYTLRAWS